MNPPSWRIHLLLLLFFAPAAHALDITVSWTNATTLEDGSPIPATGPQSILHTEVGYYLCGGPSDPDSRTWDVTLWPGESTVITENTPGEYCFNAYHKNNNGQWSVASNEVRKTVEPAAPSPPSGLTVSNTTVWTIIEQVDKFVFIAAGEVPPDTECDASESWGGRYIVPRASVAWFGNVEPLVVVADCS